MDPKAMEILVMLARRARAAKKDLRRTRRDCYRGDEPSLHAARARENEAWNALQAAKARVPEG